MQVAAAAPLREFVDFLHFKPQDNKAILTPTMYSIKKNSKKYMFGRLPAVKNAFQSVICRGYSRVTCLNANICFFSPNWPISKNLDFSSGIPS